MPARNPACEVCVVELPGWCKEALARLWRSASRLPAFDTSQNQDMSRRIHPSLRARPGVLPANARLVIIGGRFEADNRAVFEAIGELSGGRVAVLPTASSEPREAGEETRDSFRAYGIASEVVPLDKDNYRTAAFDPKLVALLERYGSFYFTGGDQTLIVQALLQDGQPTPALTAIRAAWAGGGLVAGSSAGAAIMSDPMITSGSSVEALVNPPAPDPHDTRLSIGRGLGFFPMGLVDQHFLQRGRLGRLVAALLATGGRHGFGIDENTAMVIAAGRLTVMGETGLVHVDASRVTGKRAGIDLGGLKLSYLDRGDSIDLAALKVQAGPAKRPVRVRERYFRAPTRVGKAAFAGYTTHETLARLVEGDPAHYRSETTWAYDHASGTEVAVEISRGRRAKALIEHGDQGVRVTALGFDLRVHVRTASSAEYYRNRALGGLAGPGGAPLAGRLVLLGSPLRAGAAILAELRELVTPPVGVIATASAEPHAVAAETVKLLERHGIRAVDLGATRDRLRSESGRTALIERIAGLKSFLVTGGNQRRLIDGLLFRGEETPVLKALTDAWKGGATIVAVSGGAAALSPLMIAGGSSEDALRYGVASDDSHPGLLVEPGLGLFDAGILDQNLIGSHRLGRLIVACAEEAVPFGFGLCEEAGLVVEPDRRMRVIGGQGVIVVEVDPKNLSYEDDTFAVRGVRVRVVPPQGWIAADHALPADVPVADGALTLERLVSGLRREVGAGGNGRRAAAGRISITLNAEAALRGRLDIESNRADA
jgi:cyanophycinase